MTCVSNCMSDNTEISFLDIGFTQQPHLILDRLRAAGPVSRAIMWGGVPVWLVTRYQEAKALLADPRLSKDNDKLQTLFPPNHNGAFQSSMNSNMLQSDPPDHTRLRKLVVKAFTARAVENLRGRVEEIADHLLEQIDDRGVFDLMEAFATPLPLQVISELVGIQTSNNKLFRDSVMALSDQTDRQEKDTARATLSGLLAEVIADRRKKPAGDLLSRLIEATDQGDQLSEQELMATCLRHHRCRLRNYRQSDWKRCLGTAAQSRPTGGTPCRRITPPWSGRRVPTLRQPGKHRDTAVHHRSNHRRRCRNSPERVRHDLTAVGQPRRTTFRSTSNARHCAKAAVSPGVRTRHPLLHWRICCAPPSQHCIRATNDAVPPHETRQHKPRCLSRQHPDTRA